MSDEKVSQVTGNYNRLARDLDRAIRLARFTEAQRYLLDEARELSWSFSVQAPLPFQFNLSQIQRISGFDRTGMGRARAALIAMGVFVAQSDGALLINKDYRTWVNPDGSSRLSPLQVEWCLSIKRKGRSADGAPHTPCGRRSAHPYRLSAPPADGAPHTPTDYPHPPADGAPHTPTDYPQLQVSPPVPPIGDRAPEFNTELNTELQKSNTVIREATKERADDTPPFPTEDGALFVMTGPHECTRDEAVAIWKLLWVSFANIRVSNGWYEHQRWYTAEQWRESIRELVKRGTQCHSVKLLEIIAGQIAVGKGPRPETAPPPPGPSRLDLNRAAAKTLGEKLFGPRATEGGRA